jgi:protein involved in polysaccharide export with SLBB domain
VRLSLLKAADFDYKLQPQTFNHPRLMIGVLRLASIAIVFVTLSAMGRAQGLVAPRAQPVYPGNFPPGMAPGGTYPQIGGAPERMAMVDPDKKLSAGDQVTVEIVEDRDGGLARVVTATGELDVPPLGRVRVSGKTASEAAAAIKTLLERDYYYHATVHVAIDRVSPASVRVGEVYLSGEIRVGGPLEMTSGESLTLSNAILRAGGITEWGDQNKMQITRQRREGGIDKTTVSYKKIIKSGDAKLDPVLQDGDRIYIPKLRIRVD